MLSFWSDQGKTKTKRKTRRKKETLPRMSTIYMNTPGMLVDHKAHYIIRIFQDKCLFNTMFQFGCWMCCAAPLWSARGKRGCHTGQPCTTGAAVQDAPTTTGGHSHYIRYDLFTNSVLYVCISCNSLYVLYVSQWPVHGALGGGKYR